MRFIHFVGKNILRRPTRSTLTISGVALAVGAAVSLLGIAHSFQRSLAAIFQQRGVDLVVVRAGGLQRLGSALSESLGEEIRALPEVRRVSSGLVEMFSYEEMDLFGVPARGVPPDTFLFDDLKFLSGRPLRRTDRQAVVLGKVLAANLQKSYGDTLEIVPGEPFRVVGVYESFSVFENGSMILPLRELQRIMGREGEVTAYTVILQQSDAETSERAQQKITALAPYLEALPTSQYVEKTVEIRLARAVAWMTSTLALLIGAIGMVNTMLTAVFERTAEIAVLRAIGWRKRTVVKLILCESVLLALIGAIVGSLLAIGVTWLLSRAPATERLVSGQIGLGEVAHGVVLALLLGLLGGVWPAWRAARLAPAEGIRHE